jgi:hypothetical protein
VSTIEGRLKQLRIAARLWAVGVVSTIFVMIYSLTRSLFSRSFLIFFFAGNAYVLWYFVWQLRRLKGKENKAGSSEPVLK